MFNTKSTLTSLFCLHGLFVGSVEVKEETIDVSVRSPRRSAMCPSCGDYSKRIHKKCTRTVKHMLCDGKVVQLKLFVRTFLCISCGTFREQFEGVSRKKTTEHYRQTMIPKVKDRSFSSVAKEYCVSSSTLERATTDLMQQTDVPWPKDPFALGIDEHSFAKRDMMTTITDITGHRLLEILKDDGQTTIARFLRNIPESVRKQIICVCMDMRFGFRSVVEHELPNIPLVVDKFHLIQHFNWHMGELRLAFTSRTFSIPKKLLEKNREDLTEEEQVKLKIIFKNCPPLKEFWVMKELMRKIYRFKNPEVAKRQFQDLLNGLEFDHRPRWQQLYRTLLRWKEPILNYFTYNITNAYTEGIHTRIKLLKRISYGFRNKVNYIAKMTLAFLPFVELISLLKHHLV